MTQCPDFAEQTAKLFFSYNSALFGRFMDIETLSCIFLNYHKYGEQIIQNIRNCHKSLDSFTHDKDTLVEMLKVLKERYFKTEYFSIANQQFSFWLEKHKSSSKILNKNFTIDDIYDRKSHKSGGLSYPK